MEQKDYILREIEKIALILQAIRQKFLGGNDNSSIKIENNIQQTKDMLFDELNFDVDKFMALSNDEIESYIGEFEGFNTENIDSLAKCISEIGFADKSENSNVYLKKSLQLYELNRQKSKTFSFERENNISTIKNALAEYK